MQMLLMPEKKDREIIWTGEKIKCLRKMLNISQSGLANTLDVTIRTVSRWETDKVHPPRKIIRRLEALEKKGGSQEKLAGLNREASLLEIFDELKKNLKELRALSGKARS